jgi:hypothetical protein
LSGQANEIATIGKASKRFRFLANWLHGQARGQQCPEEPGKVEGITTENQQQLPGLGMLAFELEAAGRTCRNGDSSAILAARKESKEFKGRF